MHVLGVHGSFGRAEHDAAAALVRDGEIVAAAEEERFIRYKHAVGLMPDHAIRYCLRTGGISMHEVDCVAFPRATWSDFGPRLEAFLWYRFGHVPLVTYVDHHLAHAASAYLPSGFDSALVITADQAGDGISCAAFRADRLTLTPVSTIGFPDSLGLFAALMTQYLGFTSSHDEYKLMGLAASGTPRADLSDVLRIDGGRPRIDPRVLHAEALRRHPVFHTDQLPIFARDTLPGLPPRRLPGAPLTQDHRDAAASAQRAIELGLEAYVLAHRRPSDINLCVAGGVAENSVAVGRLVVSGIFENVYAAPACGDAGTALGAALMVAAEHGFRPNRMEHTTLGPAFDHTQVTELLTACRIPFSEVHDPATTAASLLADQQIVAWFQGGMEFGPRALGARSLLADPSTEAMRMRVNRIKRREAFRPFGPSVLAEHLPDLFEAVVAAPFMSFTLPTAKPDPIIAATHIDGTSRPHTVSRDGTAYRRLIEVFHEKTGVPAVLNTSLNSGWEPIVARPDEALAFLFSSETDALVIGSCVVSKKRG